MNEKQPAAWLDFILQSLLLDRDRQSVSGDLLEEFQEQVRVTGSRLRANIWYARQIPSFVPAWLSSQSAVRGLLLSVCSLTGASGLWLGVMGLRLRHPGYVEGEVISGIIVSQALLTIAALWLRRIATLLRGSAIGCLALFWLAVKALKGVIDGSNFEGYILLIAVALVLQGIFTWAVLLTERNRPPLNVK